MIASLLTFLLAGLVVLIAVGIVMAIIGAIFSVALAVAGFLLFKVAPIVLVGYLVVRFLAPRHKRLRAAQRKWLGDE
ncbi:MAG: hypothetical protein HY703_11280 [Gemmatimonadetes bacterium]|nr:hypothetical protein [Gemmatimonadota bacterium]